jgi:hypothetical protein
MARVIPNCTSIIVLKHVMYLSASPQIILSIAVPNASRYHNQRVSIDHVFSCRGPLLNTVVVPAFLPRQDRQQLLTFPPHLTSPHLSRTHSPQHDHGERDRDSSQRP